MTDLENKANTSQVPTEDPEAEEERRIIHMYTNPFWTITLPCGNKKVKITHCQAIQAVLGLIILAFTGYVVYLTFQEMKRADRMKQTPLTLH